MTRTPLAIQEKRVAGQPSSRRRRRVCYAICVLSLASVWWGVDGFNGRPVPSTVLRSRRRSKFRRYADQERNNGEDGGPVTATWSKQARKSSGSRFQVRKRVKAVLEKARTRTGVENTSDQNPSQVIADAATLGGLGDGSVDLMVQLDETKKTNGEAADSGQTTATAFPDEVLVWKEQQQEALNGKAARKQLSRPELDSILADVPAAAKFCEPLPFTLPKLSPEQLKQIRAGERLQEQSRMGREGSGYVVFDVKAPPYVVWECLLDFESYPETIPTVREMQLFTNQKLNTGYVNEKPVLPGTGRETRHYGTPSVTRASFTLSKFRLQIAAIHKYTPHPEGDYMIFTLDPSCTNMVLKGAKGTWYTEANPEGREVGRQNSRARPLFCSMTFAAFTKDCTSPLPFPFLRAGPEFISYVKFRYPERYQDSLSIMLPREPCPGRPPGCRR